MKFRRSLQKLLSKNQIGSLENEESKCRPTENGLKVVNIQVIDRFSPQ